MARTTQQPTFVPFTAPTRMSGVDLDGTQLRKGAADASSAGFSEYGRHDPGPSSASAVERSRAQGGTPLVVAERHARLDSACSA